MFFFHAQSFATPFFIKSCTDIISIANIADAYQLDADMKEKISAICYMHDAQISKNEIIMMIDDDELYTKLNEYGKMLLEIENLFTQGSAYSQ